MKLNGRVSLKRTGMKIGIVSSIVAGAVVLGAGAAYAGSASFTWGGSGDPVLPGYLTSSRTLTAQSPKMTTVIKNCYARDPGVTDDASAKQSLMLQVVSAVGWVGTGTQPLTNCGTTSSYWGTRDAHQYRLELHEFTGRYNTVFNEDNDGGGDVGLDGNVTWAW